MHRTILGPLVLSALINSGLGAGTARAQYLVYPGGATVEGDVLNGWGIAAHGAGLYNLNTAAAQSIEVDTWMRLNQYLYASTLEQGRRRSVRLAARHQRNVEAWESIHRRVAHAPEPSDIHRGDSLNALARLIAAMGLSHSSQRFTQVGVPGGLLQKVPVVHAPSRAVISLGRLEAGEGWPLLLRGPSYEPARREYEAALDRVMGQLATRELSAPAADALARAVSDLRARVAADAAADPTDRTHARAFLDRLADTARALRMPEAEGIAGDVMGYMGTNVADLLAFMERHKLQFARAETPGERETFNELYRLLDQHHERLVASLDRK